MILAFALIAGGALALLAGFTGRSIGQVLRNEIGRGFALADIKAPKFVSERVSVTGKDGSGGGLGDVAGINQGITPKGSPKAIIDNEVLPLARSVGINVTPASVAAANARHGPTVTGGRSDHQGPPEEAWAADMSNGSQPTPQMDKLAEKLAQKFGLDWNGSGVTEKTVNGYRYQMLYRTSTGGNHYNHVHFGVKKV